MKPPYQATQKILQQIMSISHKLGEIQTATLNKTHPELRKKNRIKTIQASLQIEGNTLSIDQVTALFECKRVLGPKKDILEVQNAISLYSQANTFKPFDLKAFLHAHEILMAGLIHNLGQFRKSAVGILKGSAVSHLAPPSQLVPAQMKNLFSYLKTNKDPLLIKSCVFHYEMEFIHPFMDGNGRMGRFWQTVLLMQEYPIFEYLPLETLIKENQIRYYHALSQSDKQGHSTSFIEFMLGIIDQALAVQHSSKRIPIKNNDRLQIAFQRFGKKLFTRKQYLHGLKILAPLTASRDLAKGVKEGYLLKQGDKRFAEYKFVKNPPL